MLDPKNSLSYTIDYPIDLSSGEMAKASTAVNILLKGACFLGHAPDEEATLQSLFDIAEEIVGVDTAVYLRCDEVVPGKFSVAAIRNIPSHASDESSLDSVAVIVHQCQKMVLLDAKLDPRFRPVCDRYSASVILAFPLRHDREIIGVVVFGRSGDKTFTPTEVKLLWTLAMQGEQSLRQAVSVRTLSYYSYIDPLTHLHNRRHFNEQIDKEILRSRRSGKPFALLMIDLDGFKAYNDRYLHSAGDVALQEFAEVLRESVREVDTVARLGGDEFAVIVSESGQEGARNLAHRISDRFKKRLLPAADGAKTERLSASIGSATFPVDAFDRADLINKADRALYDAKKAGAGRTCLFSEIDSLPPGNQQLPYLPFHKIFTAARSVVDMDKFLEILLFTAMDGMSAARGSIVVTDPRGRFVLRAAIGFGSKERHLSPGTIVNPGRVTSWVVEHDKPLVMPGEDAISWKSNKKNGYTTDSFLSIPLDHEGRVLGAIHLTNRKDRRPFNQKDVSTFTPIVQEIASILSQGMDFRENVRCFSTALLQSLGDALEMRYSFLSGHGERVARLSLEMAEQLGITGERKEALKVAAELHDIGVVGIPGNLLGLKRKLNPKEMEVVRKHPITAAAILEGVPEMEAVRQIILEHHERYDGSGYPNRLGADEVSLEGKVLSLAEFYDAITSVRPHRGIFPRYEAVRCVLNGSGTLFDPAVVAAFSGLEH